jgi:hypothetical protein
MVPAVSAQGRSTFQARQEQVLTRLVENVRVVRAQMKEIEDSVRRERGQLDSMRVGPFRLLVELPFRAQTEVAARAAGARIDSVAGSAVARLGTSRIIVKSLRGHMDSVEVSITGHADYQSGLLNDSSLARWIGDRAITVLYFSLDKPFISWLKRDAVLTPDTVRADTWRQLRLQMVSSPSFVAHLCYDGDLRQCKIGLGLMQVADPVTQWFDAEGRRRLVSAAFNNYNQARRPPATVRCKEGDDASCVEYLRDGMWWVTDPIEATGRFALTQLAIEIGGKQGYERLLNSTGSPAERIAAAAGVPIDSVLSVWQWRVRNTLATSVNVTPALGAASITWVLLLAGLSLRSSRWR